MKSTAREPRDERGSGELLTLVLWADVRWLSLGWSKILFVYERCLVYSDGHLGSLYGRAALGGSAPTDHYDFVAAVADGLDALQLAAEHKRNWLVWADDVEAWSVRRGRMASRLLVRLTDGSRRKVLWAQYSRNASVFQDVEEALATCLGPR